MKKLIYITLAIVALAATSCSKNMNSGNPSKMTVEQQKTMVASSVWQVTFYKEKMTISTTDFNGYTFLFNNDGSLTANGSSETATGTWSLVKETSNKHDDMMHDSGLDDNQMTITITGNSIMDELNDDWVIVKLTDSEMWLKDDNLLSGKEVHFSK